MLPLLRLLLQSALGVSSVYPVPLDVEFWIETADDTLEIEVADDTLEILPD